MGLLVNIDVDDLSKAIAFYQRAAGLRLGRRSARSAALRPGATGCAIRCWRWDCQDPVERVEMLKAHDPYRQKIAELFGAWWKHHGSEPIRASELAEPVRCLIDPLGRGRQFVATALGKMAGTRAAGFVLMCQEADGRWGATAYALRQSANDAADGIGHRGHRGHRIADPIPADPMPPMPDGLWHSEFSAGEEESWTL